MRFLIAAGLLAPRLLCGQALGPEKADLKNFGGDIWSVWTAPAHPSWSSAEAAAGVVGIGMLTSLADSAIWAWMSSHPTSIGMRMVGPIREGWRFPLYELGSGQYILPLAGVLYVSGRLSHDVALRDAGLGCAEGHLSSAGIRELIYFSVSRQRPRDTEDPHHISLPGRKDWSWHSFLSGHIANSMSCASFLGHRYSLGPLEAIPYAYATAIGVGRMADGRHWASDTMTGALVGFAIGKAIADRQLSRASRSAEVRPVPGQEPTPLIRISIPF
ncbi:MAG TPA: phosphatase PAP2 family protein [Gemmatimonadaceae bacterium]|nr:phosphatase PAP2 family protein [Gemmatimonadaceae bacterium]